ncbi:MAG: hypothetical protein AABY10_06415 [Nanoarchaeota archaeon]
MEKNYIEKLRSKLSEAIDVEPDLLDLYTLLVCVKGEECSLEDVHDAWAIWKNKTTPNHKSLIPFFELTSEVQEMDREYAEAIRRVWSQIK